MGKGTDGDRQTRRMTQSHRTPSLQQTISRKTCLLAYESTNERGKVLVWLYALPVSKRLLKSKRKLRKANIGWRGKKTVEGIVRQLRCLLIGRKEWMAVWVIDNEDDFDSTWTEAAEMRHSCGFRCWQEQQVWWNWYRARKEKGETVLWMKRWYTVKVTVIIRRNGRRG